MATESQRPARAAQSTRRKWIKRSLLGAGIGLLVLLLTLTIGGLIFYKNTQLPNPNSDFKTNTSYVFYRDGKTKIGSLSIQNRQTIAYSTMPDSIKNAVVAAENRTFWTDKGISPSGIVRSMWTIARGGEVQGGSTITQQYIKVLYLTQDRTASRKLRELALAVKMGKTVPKETILGDYLNTIYFGRGAYGIQAAARSYFNTDAPKLTLSQSAVLASVLNNPSLFDPSGGAANKTRLLERYHYVLDGMLSMGKISQKEHDAAYKALPEFPEVPTNSTYGGTKGFLISQVVSEMKDLGYTDSQIQGGGLRITTTFDAAMQDAAVQSAQQNTALAAARSSQSAANLHAAIASVQVGTGEVLALYGGPDYVKSSRNWATTARPAASTFKAWATVAALRNGMNLYTRLQGDTFTPPGDTVPVRNENSEQYGQVTLKKAVTDSINTAFVDAVTQIPSGPSKVIQAAQDAGLSKGAGWNNDDRIPLGIAEVSPLDNAGAYATLANGGQQVQNHMVKSVTDSTGKNLYTAKFAAKQTIESDVTSDVTYALQSVVSQGTGSRVSSLGYDIAGKTGTNGVGDTINSAWFVAYTRQISTAVMYVAGDAGTSDLDKYKSPDDSAFFGGTYPAMTWADYMQTAMNGLPYLSFPDPAHVNGWGSGEDTTQYAPAPQTTRTRTTTANTPSKTTQTTTTTTTKPATTTTTRTTTQTQTTTATTTRTTQTTATTTTQGAAQHTTTTTAANANGIIAGNGAAAGNGAGAGAGG